MAKRKKPLDAEAEIMTAHEVADYLRVSPSTIYRLLKSGELRPRLARSLHARASRDNATKETDQGVVTR